MKQFLIFSVLLSALSTASWADDTVIHLVSTTDLHGYLTSSKNQNGIEVGGVDLIKGYFNAIKKADPEAVFLDSGDLFQGTIASNENEGDAVVKIYNSIGYTATAIGNHDFDFGPEGPDTVVRHPGEDPIGALKARIVSAQFAFLSANLCSVSEDPGHCADVATFKPASFSKPYLIKSVHGVQVGVIGVSTVDTPTTTMPQNVSDLRFFPMSAALDRFIPEMKSKGAQVIVVVAHAGGFCAKGVCNPKDELFAMIDGVSDSTRASIAAVFGGHTHNYINTVYNGVRTVIAGHYGQSFALLSVRIQGDTGAVSVDGTQLDDFCAVVYSDTENCKKKGKNELILPEELGQVVNPDPSAHDLIQAELDSAEKLGSTVVGLAKSKLTKDGVESAIGDFMTDAIRHCSVDSSCSKLADFVIYNNGGIRSNIPAGPVNYAKVFEVLPFDNLVATLRISGKQMRDLLAIMFHEGKPAFQISGLRVQYDPDSTATRVIQSPSGETQEFNDPIVCTEPALEDTQVYTLVTADFFATGGSGSGFVLSGIKPPAVINYDRKMRDTLVDFLKSAPQGVDYSEHSSRLVRSSGGTCSLHAD